MAYLDNAPPVLIELHKRIARSLIPKSANDSKQHKATIRGRSLTASKVLEIMLCDELMRKAWKVISKSLSSEDEYIALYDATREAMRLARRGVVDQSARKQKYEDIAKCANNLARLIAEPERGTRPNALYASDLDLLAYELLPEDVARRLGAISWPLMKSDQRHEWARSLLPRWPTVVEIIQQLAIRAKILAKKGDTNKRSRLRKGETEEQRLQKTKARIFACHLFNHLQSVDENFSGFESLRRMVKAIYMVDFTGNVLRTIILGSLSKLQVKQRKESADNLYIYP